MSFDISIADPKERIATWLAQWTKTRTSNWDSRIAHSLTLISAAQTSRTTGTAVFEFTVEDWMCNGMNNMHGGCVSTMYDDATTFAIPTISRPGFWEYGGVSRTLNCTYLRPTPCGTKVRLEAAVVHAGRKLVTLTGVMKNEAGEVLTMCEHGKVSFDSPQAQA